VTYLAEISYVACEVVSHLKLLCAFGFIFWLYSTNQRSYLKVWDIVRKVISYHSQWYYFC